MSTDSELISLQNFADNLGLTVMAHYYEDARKKTKYFAMTKDGTGISPVLNYTELNHFFLGFIRCMEMHNLTTK